MKIKGLYKYKEHVPRLLAKFIESTFVAQDRSAVEKVLYVSHRDTYQEYLRARTAAGRLLYLCGREFQENVATVYSSDWLYDKSRWDSWLRAMPIPVEGLRPAIVIDGGSHIPLEQLLSYGGGVIVLFSHPHSVPVWEVDSISLEALENALKGLERDVLAREGEAEAASFRARFRTYWEAERKRERDHALPLSMYKEIMHQVMAEQGAQG